MRRWACALMGAALLGIAMRNRVYVTSRSQGKIDWAIDQGAAGGFDSEGDFGAEMAALGGADVVIDNVGPATIRQSMRAVTYSMPANVKAAAMNGMRPSTAR